MIRISNIKAPLDYEKQPLVRFAASLLKVREDEVLSARLSKSRSTRGTSASCTSC